MSQVSFFVSSTFKDMQGERDALHRIVMPEIREFAQNYGREVDFVDLRWGISTDNLESESSSKKILSVCLDEIEECSPYQIVILGERYGWIPPVNQMMEAVGKKNYNLQKEEISITELEILFGLWKNQGNMDKCIFCMREMKNEAVLLEEEKAIYLSSEAEDRERMRSLKEMICNTPGANIISYTVDMEKQKGRYNDFTAKITYHIKNMLTKEWGENKVKGWIEREFEEEERMTSQLNECFRGRETELEELENHATICKLVISTVKEGNGASSIMAMMKPRFEKKGFRTANIYCGNGFCRDTEQLLKIMCAHLEGKENEEEYGLVSPESGERKKWKEKWNQLALEYKGRNIIFFIDGIHHLSMDEGVEESEFLPSNGCSDKIYFVITTNSNTQISPLAVEKVGRWCDYFEILECPKEDVRTIIQSKMKKEHKDLSEKVMKELLAHPLISNMLCMELILQDILVMDHRDFEEIQKLEEIMDGNSAIDTYLCQLIQKHPKTEKALIEFWFMRSLKILSEHDKAELNYLYYMLSGLIMSVNGIATQDMAAMSEYMKENLKGYQFFQWLDYWEETRFTKFRRYMGKMVHRMVDGRYRFSHGQIRSALYKNKTIRKLVSGHMMYYESLPDESLLKQENLIPSFLIYVGGREEQTIRENWETYCFSYIKRQYSLKNSEDREISSIGRKAVEKMANSIKMSLSYCNGTTYPNHLFILLRMKAEDGATLLDPELKFFIDELSYAINKTNEYERSILLSAYISLAIGYEKWMLADEKYKKPEEKRFWTELGRFKEWSRLEKRLLMHVYTNACELYHELRMFINRKDNVIIPEWNWTILREKAAHYINLLSNDTDVIRNYYCSRIMLMDTDRILLENRDISTQNIIMAEKFIKRLMGSKYEKGTGYTNYVIRCYVNTMVDIVRNYIVLGRSVEGIVDQKTLHNVYGEAIYQLEKMIKMLKKRKYIKEYVDLEKILRVKYCIACNEAGFYYYEEEKQNFVDSMWTLQNNMRSDPEFMNSPAIREEIKNGGVALMEFLLQGYVPSCYQKENGGKISYALSLLNKEAVYMLAKGENSKFAENIYYYYLIRALFEMEGMDESNHVHGGGEGTIHSSIQLVEGYLDQWKDEDGKYIYKLKWLLNWYKEQLKIRNNKNN